MAVTFLLWTATLLLFAAMSIAGYFVVVTRRIAADAERRVPPVGKFVEIDGNRIHYVETGQGRPILFIHGLGGTLHHFRQPLFGRLHGYRLVALDRPGSGYSSLAPGASGRLRQQARVLASFIEAAGLEKPLLVGHSLGGAVALAVALDHAWLVSGLALISPLTHSRGKGPDPFAALAVPSQFRRWLLSNTIAVPAALKQATATLAYIFAPQAVPAGYMTEGGGYAGLRPAHVYGTSSDYTDLEPGLSAQQERYAELALPVGILFGTADQVLNPEEQGLSMQGQIAGLELELLDGIGHMPQFAVPERAAAFIERIAQRAFRGSR